MIKKLLVSWVEAHIGLTKEREARVYEKNDEMKNSDSWYLKGRLDAFMEMRDLLISEDRL